MRPTLNHRLLALAALACVAPAAADFSYEGEVRKVLKKHCVVCHKGNRARADLDLSSYDAILAGSASGDVVIPGKADDSFLYLVTAHVEEPAMPPGDERIPDDDLEVLRQWIDAGLPKSAADITDPAPMAKTATTEPARPETMGEALPRGPLLALAASADRGLIAVAEQLRVVLHDASDGSVVGVLPFPKANRCRSALPRTGSISLPAGASTESPVRSSFGRSILFDAFGVATVSTTPCLAPTSTPPAPWS